MPRHNIPRNKIKDGQWSKAYVQMPKYPYICEFRIKSMRVRCINTSAQYYATDIIDVRDHDHPLIDRLIVQI